MIPQQPLEESRRDALGQEEILAFCRQLQRTVKTLGLYGVEHPATVAIHDELLGLYQQITEERDEILLAFGPSQLIIDDEIVDDLSPPLRSLCEHMQRLGIARLILRAGACEEEIVGLAVRLATLPTAAADGSAAPLFQDDPFPHFRLAGLDSAVTVANDDASFTADLDLSDRERQLWYALATGRGGGSDEPLTREALAFFQELLHREGSVAQLVHESRSGDAKSRGTAAVVSGRLLAKLFKRLGNNATILPAEERGAFLRDLGTRALELDPTDMVELLSDSETRVDLLAQSLQTTSEEQILDIMAALLRVEGADSERLAHCIGAFMKPEGAATRLLPGVQQRLHESTELSDGEALTVWRRIEELALDSLGQRYMSTAYEDQLDDFASARFPTLGHYKTVHSVLPEDLASLDTTSLSHGHTQLLLDLLADEGSYGDFELVVEALFTRLTDAIDQSDYELATLIAGDLRKQCSHLSERPRDFKQVIWTHLGRLDLAAITDRAFTEIESIKTRCFDGFNTFLKIFQGAIAPHLLDRLDDEEDRAVRRSILRILGSFADDLIPELLTRLDSSHWYYVRNIVHLLGQSGSEEAVRPLTMQLQHKDARVRREALVALRSLGSQRCIPFVARLLADDAPPASQDNDQVRVEAARCLARFPVEAATAALRKGVLSKRPTVANACRRFLNERH
jgi:hypothetical protein